MQKYLGAEHGLVLVHEQVPGVDGAVRLSQEEDRVLGRAPVARGQRYAVAAAREF